MIPSMLALPMAFPALPMTRFGYIGVFFGITMSIRAMRFEMVVSSLRRCFANIRTLLLWTRPAPADLYPTCAVVLIACGPWIVASLSHHYPSVV